MALPPTQKGPEQGRTISSEASITLTVPSPWLTTKTKSPSVLMTAQTGEDPTVMSLITVLSMVEISVTLLLPWFTTKILLLAALPAIITGLESTTGSTGNGIVLVTASTPVEITLTLLLSRLAI